MLGFRPFSISEHTGYRFGFNGMEKDDEVYGSGESYDFGARLYSSRLGRWSTVDIKDWKYPSESPYSGMGLNPVAFMDPDGEEIVLGIKRDASGKSILTITLTGIVSFDHLTTTTSSKQKDDYVNNLNAQLKSIYSKNFGGLEVEMVSNLRLASDAEITSSDHVVYVTNLNLGDQSIDNDHVGGFVNQIGGKIAYFPRSCSFRTAAHEIGHWLGLFHPKNYASLANLINATPDEVSNLFSSDNIMHHAGDPGTIAEGGENFDQIQAEIIKRLYDAKLLNKGGNQFNLLGDYQNRNNSSSTIIIGATMTTEIKPEIENGKKPPKNKPKSNGGVPKFKGTPEYIPPR